MNKILMLVLILLPSMAHCERRISSILNYAVLNHAVGCYIGPGMIDLTLSNPSSIVQTAKVAFKFVASNFIGPCVLQTQYTVLPGVAATAWAPTAGTTCNRVVATGEVNCPAINVSIPSGSHLIVSMVSSGCNVGSQILGAGSSVGIEITENAGHVLGSVTTACHADPMGNDAGTIAHTNLVGGHAF